MSTLSTDYSARSVFEIPLKSRPLKEYDALCMICGQPIFFRLNNHIPIGSDAGPPKFNHAVPCTFGPLE